MWNYLYPKLLQPANKIRNFRKHIRLWIASSQQNIVEYELSPNIWDTHKLDETPQNYPLGNTRKNPKLVFTSSPSTNVFSIISITQTHAYFAGYGLSLEYWWGIHKLKTFSNHIKKVLVTQHSPPLSMKCRPQKQPMPWTTRDNLPLRARKCSYIVKKTLHYCSKCIIPSPSNIFV